MHYIVPVTLTTGICTILCLLTLTNRHMHYIVSADPHNIHMHYIVPADPHNKHMHCIVPADPHNRLSNICGIPRYSLISNPFLDLTRSTRRAETSLAEALNYSQVTHRMYGCCESAKRQQCYHALHAICSLMSSVSCGPMT